MSKQKHTPAPWAWQKFGSRFCLTAQHGMREIILSASHREKVPYVAMNQDGILKPIDPNHPNAKLIAAAPELKDNLQLSNEMLESLLFLFGEGMAMTTKFGVIEQFKANEAAIKKATE